jgi:DNA-binding transcriptional ArsR family regulator
MVKYKSDHVFEALGNPVRRQMFEKLARNGSSEGIPFSELAQPFDMSLPAALKHVGILEESGLVVCKKEGRVKYCAANLDALTDALAWMNSLEHLWEERLDRLENYLTNNEK